MNWENYRRQDGTLDLVAIWEDDGRSAGVLRSHPVNFLRHIEEMQKINSRQAAAIAVATAVAIANLMER